MTIDERADGTVVVNYDSLGLTRVMLAATVLLIAVAGYDAFAGARGTERLVGLLGSAATCLLVGIVFLERSWFQFAPAPRVVTWRRRWALRHRAGTIPFNSIEELTLSHG